MRINMNKNIKTTIPESNQYELRVCSGGNVTINQVRAYRWEVLVIEDRDNSQVYIIPPHQIAKMVLYRKGQHSASQYESATLNLPEIKKTIKPIHVSEFNTDIVKEAVLQSEKYSAWKKQLTIHREEIVESRSKVDAMLEDDEDWYKNLGIKIS